MAENRWLCEESPDPGQLAKDPASDSDEESTPHEESTPLRVTRPPPLLATTLKGRRKLALRKQCSVPYWDTETRGPRTPSMDKTHSLDTANAPRPGGMERTEGLENLSEHPQDISEPITPPNGIPTDTGQGTSQIPATSDKFKTFYIKPRLNRRSVAEEKPSKKSGGFSNECPCLKRRRKKPQEEDPDDIYMQEDPFRKRCTRACLNIVYILLALFAAVFTYSLIQDLVRSMNNPVRSIHYHRVDDYDAPGIAVYPGGADFLACGHYYNNVVTSKVRLTQLDLLNRNCTFTRLNYGDPNYPEIKRDVIVVRGPTSFKKREAIFLHFSLEDETRDFYTVSYFVFRGWDMFNASENRNEQMQKYHSYMPTFALSAGLRMWIKLIMSETFLMDDTNHTDFKVEYSVVKFWDKREQRERKKHLFFIFFEWKNDIIERSYLLYTTTPWSIGAGLCGVLLTLHRGVQFAQTSYKRVQKDKERRSIRKRTLRELRQQRSVQKQSSTDTAL